MFSKKFIFQINQQRERHHGRPVGRAGAAAGVQHEQQHDDDEQDDDDDEAADREDAPAEQHEEPMRQMRAQRPDPVVQILVGRRAKRRDIATIKGKLGHQQQQRHLCHSLGQLS